MNCWPSGLHIAPVCYLGAWALLRQALAMCPRLLQSWQIASLNWHSAAKWLVPLHLWHVVCPCCGEV